MTTPDELKAEAERMRAAHGARGVSLLVAREDGRPGVQLIGGHSGVDGPLGMMFASYLLRAAATALATDADHVRLRRVMRALDALGIGAPTDA
jgi:hypothetical protein